MTTNMLETGQCGSQQNRAADGSEWREGRDDLPAEVRLMISAFDAASSMLPDRRRAPRCSYRFRTLICLVGEPPGAPPHVVFTRDINEWGLGFLTRDNLPLARAGRIDLPLKAEAPRR